MDQVTLIFLLVFRFCGPEICEVVFEVSLGVALGCYGGISINISAWAGFEVWFNHCIFVMDKDAIEKYLDQGRVSHLGDGA